MAVTSAEKTVFISRAGADAGFAAEIGRILESAGYPVILQQWDFANRNFIERMHAALAQGARVVALLSPEYLRSDHCQAEWQNAIAADPLNTKSRLILLRVAECEPAGLLSGLAYWDLVPIRDNRALLRDIVLDAVREGRRDASAGGPYWRAPRTIVDAEAIRPVPSFSGRDEELSALSAALETGSGIAAVHGLGGVGKSSVAREYAWRNRDRYSVIWWLNAQTETGIIDGLLRLGALFVRGLDQLADRRAAAQQVTTSVLSGFERPLLLVFDNLEDERLLHAWRPRTNSRALVTSRNAAWGADVTAIPVEAWELGTASAYLQRESGRADLSQADARKIAEALGALPLALAHAAASLRGMRMVTPGGYLDRIGEHLKKAPRGAEYPQPVFATFRAAIAQAESEAAGAAAVLYFAASFAPDAIPDELFRRPIDNCPAALATILSEGASLDLDEALGALDRLSLLAFAERSRAYSIHRLVQLAARDMIAQDASAWRECAVRVANAVFPKVRFEVWPQCERLLPHARAALDAWPGDVSLPAAGRLAHECAVYLRERGDYDAAEPLQLRALSIRETALGEHHPDVGTSLDDLAILYFDQARYEEAEPIYLRALGILERALGPEHREVGTSLNSLACLYFMQGRYAEAEPLQVRALAVWEKSLGQDHANVGRALSNLAGVYYAQERYEEAEPRATRALAITEKALGPDNPHVAIYLNNVAEMHYRLGCYGEAEPLLARALTIWEKGGLGPDHPDVAMSLNILGNVYEGQERFEDAEATHARALAIREKALGPAHPAVATSLNGLATVRCRQRRYEEAERLFIRALSIQETALGSDHPDVASTLRDFANMYEAQGRVEEAQPLHARALAIQEKMRGG